MMRTYKKKFKHKHSGAIKTVLCIDDYFGRHQYGYIVEGLLNGVVLNDSEFNKKYEAIDETA